MRFLCSTFGDGVAGLCVDEDGGILLTAALAGVEAIEASIAVGPEGTCACWISAGDTRLAATAPDARSFEQVLKSRLARVGARSEDREP